MKKLIIIFSVLCACLLWSQTSQAAGQAYPMATRLAGRILLQVEENGEAWYVHPDTKLRYYMADGNSAYEMMRYFGLGINETNFARLEKNDRTLLSQVRGKIVLRVELSGEAYYIKPDDLTMHYLANGEEAYRIMREKSLGITNDNLEKILVGQLVQKSELPITGALEVKNIEASREYYNKGFDIWVRTKDYKSAEALYLLSLQNDPDYAAALSSYGYIQGAFNDDYLTAEKYIMRAMQLDPTWPYAPYNLGILYDLNNQHCKGVKWVQFAIDKFYKHPDRAYFQQTLGVMQDYSYCPL